MEVTQKQHEDSEADQALQGLTLVLRDRAHLLPLLHAPSRK